MKKKGSKSESMTEKLTRLAVPPLVSAYKSAVTQTCFLGSANNFNVSAKDYPKFVARQKQLDSIRCSYDRYAITAVIAWWGWCKSHGMRAVPVSLFCGKKSWERFLKIYESTVEVQTPVEDDFSKLVYFEYRVAQLYVGNMMTGGMEPVSMIRKMLKVDPPIASVQKEVLYLLSLQYGSLIESYDDLYYLLSNTEKGGRTSASNIHEHTEVQAEDLGVHVEAEMVGDIRADN